MFHSFFNKRSAFLLIIAFSPLHSFSQLVKINSEDALEADKYKDLYPEESYASLLTKETYTFSYNAKDDLVEATQQFEESILCLKELNSTFSKAIYYNEKSEVYRIGAYNYKNKPLTIYPSSSKYKSAGFFYDDAMIKSFSLSFSRIGDKNKYIYYKKYKDVKYLTKIFFHTGYPIKKKTVEFVVPNWLEVEFLELNFEGYDIVREENKDKKGNKVIRYTLNDIAPVNNENFSANFAISFPHILVLSKSYTYKEQTKNLFKTTDDLYSWYASLVKEIENKSETLEKKVNQLTEGTTTEEEKIKNIYYWVQDNIRYIAFEDGIMGFKPASAQDVYSKKYGDCKGMANLMSEMLKIAGLDARLTWIGTRSIPYNYSIPSLAVDNHMITTVYIKGEPYFLDATETGIAFGDYAHRIQGQDALIENGETYVIDTIPEFDANHNISLSNFQLELKENMLVGKGKEKLTGEEKTIFYRNFINTPLTERASSIADNIRNNDKNIIINNLTASDFEKREDSVILEYDISIQNQITELNNELYINTEFIKDFAWSKTKDNRINDLDFGRKMNIEKNTYLNIPNTFKVDYVPQKLNIANDDFEFHLEYVYNQEKNQLKYIKKILIKSGLIKRKNIEPWNNAIKELNHFYNDQIILIKK